nr:MAG TPA: hypothetical protein [Bacteriophage sp.]
MNQSKEHLIHLFLILHLVLDFVLILQEFYQYFLHLNLPIVFHFSLLYLMGLFEHTIHLLYTTYYHEVFLSLDLLYQQL